MASESNWRKLPRKPGAGRKPVAPGGLVRVTVTLSPADIAMLKAIDGNLSGAIRQMIAKMTASGLDTGAVER